MKQIIVGKKRRKEKVPAIPTKRNESVDTAPEEKANLETIPTEECDQPVNLEVGQFAALHLHKYDEIPQLANILC